VKDKKKDEQVEKQASIKVSSENNGEEDEALEAN